MDYIGKNIKTHDCAIVGALNALTWLKKEANYVKVEKVAKKDFKYNPKVGLKCSFLKDFMHSVGVNIESLEDIPLQDAEKMILNGNAVVALVTRKGEKDRHVVFLKPNGRRVEVLNLSMDWIDIVMDFRKKEIELSMWVVGGQVA